MFDMPDDARELNTDNIKTIKDVKFIFKVLQISIGTDCPFYKELDSRGFLKPKKQTKPLQIPKEK